YTSCEIEHIDLDLQEILFEAKDGNFFLRKEIKEKIIFSEIDFFQDSLLLNIDVIIARNFLSILSPEYFSKAVSIFNLSLIDEGFLVLSSGEKVEINQEMFYQNQDLEEKNFFVNKICDNYDKMSLIEKYEQPKLIEAMLYQTMKNLQDQFVVVSKNDLRIILRKGNLEEYIETGKEKEDNLLVLAKDSIRYELEEAIKFVKEHNTSKLEKVPYYTKEGKANMVYLDVIPLPDNNIARDLFLVLFFHPSGKSDNYHTNKRPGVKFR
ncbi:MAG: hypothetical protein OIF32_07650, partial [Campylobacterales bacterium]|nr:hypothetical protein [Campylobacterales bacterium]